MKFMNRVLPHLISFAVSSVLFLLLSTLYVHAVDSIWIDSLDMPYQIANHNSYIFNGVVYTFAGSTSYVTGRVLSSTILPGGSLLTWETSSSAIPKQLFWHSGAFKDLFVYILGGNEYPGGNATSTNAVYLGKIEGNNIGNWVAQNSLAYGLADGAAVVIGDRLYHAGGGNYVGNIGNVT